MQLRLYIRTILPLLQNPSLIFQRATKIATNIPKIQQFILKEFNSKERDLEYFSTPYGTRLVSLFIRFCMCVCLCECACQQIYMYILLYINVLRIYYTHTKMTCFCHQGAYKLLSDKQKIRVKMLFTINLYTSQ